MAKSKPERLLPLGAKIYNLGDYRAANAQQRQKIIAELPNGIYRLFRLASGALTRAKIFGLKAMIPSRGMLMSKIG
jgi:hypothetical protein